MLSNRKTLLAASLVGLAATAGTPLFAQAPGYGYYPGPAAYGAPGYAPPGYGAPGYGAPPLGGGPGYAGVPYGPPMTAQAPSPYAPVPGPYAPASYSSGVTAPDAAPSCTTCTTGGDAGCTTGCNTGCDAGCEPKCDTGCDSGCDKGCGPFCGGCVVCDPCHQPLWRVSAGVIFLQRDRPTAVVVANDAGNPGNLLTTNAIDFDYEPGLELGVARNFGRMFAAEARYFGLNHWGESALFTADAAGNATSPFLTAGPDDQILLTEKTELHSAEFNLRASFISDSPWRASLLSGFRYFYLDDETDLTGLTAGAATQLTRVTAASNLFGTQIGGDIGRRIGEQGAISAFAKGGIFATRLSQHTTQIDAGATVNELSADNDSLATMFEAGFNGTLQPTRWLNIRAGYQVLALGGVALSAEQLPFINGGPPADGIDDNGNIVLHGPTAGFDIIW